MRAYYSASWLIALLCFFMTLIGILYNNIIMGINITIRKRFDSTLTIVPVIIDLLINATKYTVRQIANNAEYRYI